jgi:Na+/proline symporter
LLVIVYTVAGGSDAVSHTQKYQLAVIFAGMFAALAVLLHKLPAGLTFTDTLMVAGGFGKLQAVDFSLNPDRRYTFWSGTLGGMFLALSYFGTDQSQVQRYISSASLRESRMGLMFNAVCKIPMQFFILMLGVLLFVFYQFERPPLFFNQPVWTLAIQHDPGQNLRPLEEDFAKACEARKQSIRQWIAAKHAANASEEAAARAAALAADEHVQSIRAQTKTALAAAAPGTKANDADYVFISFILSHLPHGLIGLLVAAFFAAALSSKAAELNALGSTTTIDVYRHLVRRHASDAHYVLASKCFTMLWGLVAIAFALFANLVENLIQAVNIVGSIFYGVVLAMFLVAFFVKRVGGTAIFWAAIAAQLLIFVLYARLEISYLWYNVIGCVACVVLSMAIQVMTGSPPQTEEPD